MADETDLARCACGSGLRAIRCCALDPAALPLAESEALLETLGNEAVRLFNEKKYEEAAALALKLLDLAPHMRAPLRTLFEIRKAQKQAKAAEALGARLAKLPGPAAQRAAANTQFAQYLINQERHEEAVPYAAEVVKAKPGDATAQHLLGVALTESGSLRAGERHYRQAVRLLGREDGVPLANLAWNLKLQGRLEEAASLYEKALALAPENRRGAGGQAQVEYARGDKDRAVRLLDEALERWPDDKPLRLLRAMAALGMGQYQDVLDRLGAREALLPPELLVRSRALARLERFGESVADFTAARRILRETGGASYKPAPLEARAAAYRAYFTADRVRPLPRAGAGAFQPVFLLGFPRAGSALLEQMLAAVPGFAASDDFAPVAELLSSIPGAYPESLDALLAGEGGELPDRLRTIYEGRRAAMGLLRPGVGFVTDRAPSNVWHLGLIKLLYPEAPIIHVLRHPYDLVISNIMQEGRVAAGANGGMAELAAYFGLHAGMIRHYRGQLTLRYLPVRYEELVADPAGGLARVLDFIGTDTALPPRESLIANDAPARDPVPAHYAARETVRAGGAYRHRAYLRAVPDLLGEVKDVLAPWISELGYDEGGVP